MYVTALIVKVVFSFNLVMKCWKSKSSRWSLCVYAITHLAQIIGESGSNI